MNIGDRVKFVRWYPLNGYAKANDFDTWNLLGCEGEIIGSTGYYFIVSFDGHYSKLLMEKELELA